MLLQGFHCKLCTPPSLMSSSSGWPRTFASSLTTLRRGQFHHFMVAPVDMDVEMVKTLGYDKVTNMSQVLRTWSSDESSPIGRLFCSPSSQTRCRVACSTLWSVVDKEQEKKSLVTLERLILSGRDTHYLKQLTTKKRKSHVRMRRKKKKKVRKKL